MNAAVCDEHETIRSVYIHVPFCVHRCGYCDFTLVARRDDLIPRYLGMLAVELRQLEHRRGVDTIFIGGGTPTHLDVDQLKQLMSLLSEWFEWDDEVEFSVEANPFGLTPDKVSVLADAGVNRISLGVQSFDDDLLKILERDHRGPEIEAAISAVRHRIDNLAMDLIFGIPGQTIESWSKTLDRAVSFQPCHLSTYGLTFEKGTTFWSRLQRRELDAVSDGEERRMYEIAMDQLPLSGYAQYEISNFAQPEKRCRHNEVYWNGGSYWGFGPGAARHDAGRREQNHRSVFTWLKRLEHGLSAAVECEQLDGEQRARELAVLKLRTARGLDLADFEKRYGWSVSGLLGSRFEDLLGTGWLERKDGFLRLTREGRCFADSIAVEFL